LLGSAEVPGEKRARELGAALATPALIPRLIELAGCLGRDDRGPVLGALARLGATLPRSTLLALVSDAVSGHIWDGDLDRVLLLAGPIEEEIARVLDRLDPWSRRQVLLRHAYGRPRGWRAVVGVLWRRWIDEPDEYLARFAGPGFPGAIRTMARVTAALPDGADVWAQLHGFPMLTIERAGAAEALALPPHQLLGRLGAARLHARVIEALGAARQVARSGSRASLDVRLYHAAQRVLRALPEIGRPLGDLLAAIELDASTPDELIAIALDVDRPALLRHIAGELGVWRTTARLLAHRPEVQDIAFLEAAARSCDAETAYHALDALDAIDGPLPATAAGRLPGLRLAVARARRGDRAALVAVLDATRDAEVRVRADAVRWLGRIDHDGAHVAAIERALADDGPVVVDHADDDQPRTPVAERAAIALGAVAVARTALLRRYFTVQTEACREIIQGVLAEQPGAAEPYRAWSPFDLRPRA
jgi:hypothetical protein